MDRSRGKYLHSLAGSGFEVGRKRAASHRLTDAVMVSLMAGSLSLCVIVALTMLSIKSVLAAPCIL